MAIALLAALAGAVPSAAQRSAPLRNATASRMLSFEACTARLADAERAARFRATSEEARLDVTWSFTETPEQGRYRAFSAARNVATRTADTRIDAVYVYEYSCVGPTYHEVSDAWVQERPRAEPFKF